MVGDVGGRRPPSGGVVNIVTNKVRHISYLTLIICQIKNQLVLLIFLHLLFNDSVSRIITTNKKTYKTSTNSIANSHSPWNWLTIVIQERARILSSQATHCFNHASDTFLFG